MPVQSRPRGRAKRRVGVIDQAAQRRDRGPRRIGSIAVGPGYVFGEARRSAAARDELAEPDRRFLAFAVVTDELDLVVRIGEMGSKSLAGPSLMAPAGTRLAADFQKSGPGS